jgi:hypothetical protein
VSNDSSKISPVRDQRLGAFPAGFHREMRQTGDHGRGRSHHYLNFERRARARDALPGAEIELVVVCEASQDAAWK